MNSKLYNEAEFEAYSIYKSDDLIQGTLRNSCRFSMAEILTKATANNKYDTPHTLFHRLFVEIESQKAFNVKLYLRKNKNFPLIYFF